MNNLLELRKAIAVHHTDTTDAAWDGGMMTKRCPAEAAPLRLLHAWIDSEGDKDSKGNYKFPHHMVSAGGDVGVANMKACQSGIGVLNGGMGGADIPDSDRKGVYNHLAAHLKDGDLTPPELKAVSFSPPLMEHRSFNLDEIRASEEDGAPKIIGHAAIFNTPTVLMEFANGWKLIERIEPGAFKKAIKQDDVRAFVDHNPSKILGRIKAGTLRLKEDATGLFNEIDVPNTQAGKDIIVSMLRGDIDQESFSFKPRIEEVVEDSNTKTITRILRDVKLFDVSIVSLPQYEEAKASLRSLVDRVTAEFPFLTQENQEEGEQEENENKGVPVELLLMELELSERV